MCVCVLNVIIHVLTCYSHTCIKCEYINFMRVIYTTRNDISTETIVGVNKYRLEKDEPVEVLSIGQL